MNGKRPNLSNSAARDEKRSRFLDEKGSSDKSRRILALSLVGALALAALYVAFGGRDRDLDPGYDAAMSTPGQDVRIQVTDLSDEQAKFYNYTLPSSQKVRFFAVKSSDGVVRAAFDACDVCFKSRRGYRQEGDDMVCNNCGRHFPSTGVNTVSGGCNPAPLARAMDGDQIVIKARDLEQGAVYF